MENKKKTEFIIIDANMFRGTDDEIQKMDILEETNQTKLLFDKADHDSEEVKNNYQASKVIFIVYGIIQKLQKEKQINAVIFFQYETKNSVDMNELNISVYKEYKAKVIIGNQSLFFFLGQNSSIISNVYWISKEKMFFSKSFYDTIEKSEYKFEYQTYLLNEFKKMVKHL